jgi:hypothetical protein
MHIFLSFVFKPPGNDEIPTDARHFAQFYPGGPLDSPNSCLVFSQLKFVVFQGLQLLFGSLQLAQLLHAEPSSLQLLLLLFKNVHNPY